MDRVPITLCSWPINQIYGHLLDARDALKEAEGTESSTIYNDLRDRLYEPMGWLDDRERNRINKAIDIETRCQCCGQGTDYKDIDTVVEDTIKLVEGIANDVYHKGLMQLRSERVA